MYDSSKQHSDVYEGQDSLEPVLWLTRAGTHPTGDISGIPGMAAAKTMIKRTGRPASRPQRARRLISAR